MKIEFELPNVSSMTIPSHIPVFIGYDSTTPIITRVKANPRDFGRGVTLDINQKIVNPERMAISLKGTGIVNQEGRLIRYQLEGVVLLPKL